MRRTLTTSGHNPLPEKRTFSGIADDLPRPVFRPLKPKPLPHGVQARMDAFRALPRWGTYEANKRAWIAANPGATPAEYEAAMRKIARDADV